MQRNWLLGVFSVFLFHSLVISFHVHAGQFDKNDAPGCEPELVGQSANPGQGLADILRVRIMPAGSEPVSLSATHDTFLLAPPESLVEQAIEGQPQGHIKMGKLGMFAVFVRPTANGNPRLMICRASNLEQCVFSHDLGRGELVKGFYMVKQEIDETLVHVETNYHQFLLKLTR